MSARIVVATFVAKPDRIDEIEKFAREVIVPSHSDAGCEKYALHRSVADPNTFVLVEKWASQEDLDAHFVQPHMANLGSLMEALAEPASIQFLEPFEAGDPAKGLL